MTHHQSISDSLQILDWKKIHLEASVKDFIHNNQWCIPEATQNMYHALLNLISLVKILVIETEDEKIWSLVGNGLMSRRLPTTFMLLKVSTKVGRRSFGAHISLHPNLCSTGECFITGCQLMKT